MAMSGKITKEHTTSSGNNRIYAYLHWTATKDTTARKITITCYLELDAESGSFYSAKNTCTFTINGKTYSVSTPATDAYDESFTTSTVTADISISSIDKIIPINVSASFANSFSVFKGLTVSSSKFPTSGTINIDPLFTSTEIALTGTEISNQSIIDVVNHRTYNDVTHSLSYNVGGDTVEVLTEESGDYLTFTLPETLARRIPNSDTLSVKLTLTTHFPWGVSGSKSLTVIYSLPDKDIFKPHCNIEVTDGEHRNNVQLVDKYGAFIKGYSRFRIVAEPVPSYGSEITSITITANDETHVGYNEVETKFLTHVGEQTIVVSLIDNRGRSNEYRVTKNVIDYLKPYISDLKVDRCDRVGELDSDGEYIKVTFDAEITPLGNLNSASYTLQYMTSAGLDQHDVNLTDYTGQYTVTGGTYIFKADSDNTYSVTLTAIDDLDETSEHEGADESVTIWNALASGDGFAFGKVAELSGVLENMFKFFPIGGFTFPEFNGTTLLSPRIIPNVYSVRNGQDISYSPFTGEYALIVIPGGGVNDLLFIAISNDPEIKINTLVNSAWGSWKTLTLT